MLTDVEVQIQRAMTDAFINADAEPITLHRTTKDSDGAGGFIRTSVTLLPQVFRLIPQSDKTPVAMNNDGEQEKVQFVLLGVWNADMMEADWFTFRGEEYLLRTVLRTTNGYQTKGDAIYRG